MTNNFEIPGLIAKERVLDEKEHQMYKLAIEKMKQMGMKDQMIKDQVAKQLAKAAKPSSASMPLASPAVEVKVGNGWINNYGYSQPYDPFGSTKSAPYGGGMPQTVTIDDLYRMTGLPKQERQRTALEELVDGMFDTSEKEQFLIELGYEFFVDQKGFDSFRRGETVWNKALDLEKVFMKEIRIKFKNLIMTKQTLKFKF